MQKIHIGIGDKFLLEDSRYKGLYYLYALVSVTPQDNQVNLINWNNGSPWTKPIKVKYPHSITDEEFARLTKGHEFKKIRI